MHSIRTKITLMMVIAILVVIIAATVLGVFTIRNMGYENANQLLLLLCESGEKNLTFILTAWNSRLRWYPHMLKKTWT